MSVKRKMASLEIPPLPGSAGDLIVFHRGLYKHYAVNVGNGYIVHVTSSDFNELTSADAESDEAWKFERSSVCSTFDKAVIRKEKYKDYAKPGDQVYVETHAEKAFPSEVIVERANSKVGRTNYNFIWNNCEHFARWCCCGEAISIQGDNFTWATATSSGLFILWKLATRERRV